VPQRRRSNFRAASDLAADNQSDPAEARDRALRLLTRREHSARELKRKLEERGFDEAAADDAVSKLADGGLQSDGRYAEQMIRTRLAQGYGPVRIEADLRQAGLNAEQIQDAMAATDCDWTERAAHVHARKFRDVPRTQAERARQYRFLMGRGYEPEQIRRVLKGELAD
jgi:regulatory protein